MVRWRFGCCVLLAVSLLAGTSGCKTSSSSLGDGLKGSSLGAESNFEEQQQKEKLVTFSIAPDPFSPELSGEEDFVAELGRVDALSHYSHALILEMNNQSEEAFVEYVQAANADPANEPLMINVARQLIAMGNQADAVTLLEISASRKNASSSIHSWLALALASSGDIKAAIKAARLAVKKSKDSPLAYQVLFGIYLDQGKNKEALKVLESAEREAANSPRFKLELSQLYLNNKEEIEKLELDPVEKATELARQVEEEFQSQEPAPEQLELLANTYEGIGEKEKALGVYEKLLSIYPGHTGLRGKRASVLLSMGEVEKAKTEFLLLVRQNPNPDSSRYCVILGDIFQQEKNYRLAATFYNYAATMNPKNPELYLLVGTMHLAAGAEQSALDAFELARTAGLRSYRLESLTGMTYVMMDRYAEGIESLRQAEAIDKEEGGENLDVNFYLSLADLYEKNRDRSEAIKIMEELLEKNPDSAACLNALGYTWAEEGIHLEKAHEMIERALKSEPDSPAFLDSLAWVLYKMGRSEEALPHQLRTLELSKEEPEALMIYCDHLGDIYQALGKKEEALNTWKKALEVAKKVKIFSSSGYNQKIINKIQEKVQGAK